MTIGIYRTEQNCNFESEEGMQAMRASLNAAVADMLYIKKKMDAAADKAHKEPLNLDISALLIPNWDAERFDEISFYQMPIYLQKKKFFMQLLKEVVNDAILGKIINGQIKVLDFLKKAGLTDSEKAYMENLKALGSNADIIKTRAIINNIEHKHLQIDSNTKIYNFDTFYHSTFCADTQEDAFDAAMDAAQDRDAFNASYYDEAYVSVHNKVVYTVPRSQFVTSLRERYLEYCREHQNDEQSKERNSIYSKVFSVAAYQAGIARKNEVPIRGGRVKVIYPAKMEDETAFRITKDVVTAVNQSWKPNLLRPQGLIELTRIPGMRYGDTTFDYACYQVIMKKLTGTLTDHKIQDDIEPSFDDIGPSFDDIKAKDQLLKLSNWIKEEKASRRFEQYVIEYTAKNRDLSNEIKEMMFDIIFCDNPGTQEEKEKRAIEQFADSSLAKEEKDAIFNFFLENNLNFRDRPEELAKKTALIHQYAIHQQKVITSRSRYPQSAFYNSAHQGTLNHQIDDSSSSEKQKNEFPSPGLLPRSSHS